MPVENSPYQPNFDRVARIYRWAEYLALGPALQKVRTHFLHELDGCRYAFVLGDGDGRFLEAFMRRNQIVNVTAVDTSQRMLNLLSERCSPYAQRLHTQQGSALRIVPEAATDLIASHFFLDCLTQLEVEDLASTYASHCQSGTLWLVSDFGIPHNPLLRIPGKLYVRLLYAAFRLLTGLRVQQLPNISDALQSASFRVVIRHESLGGLLYTQLWKLNKRSE